MVTSVTKPRLNRIAKTHIIKLKHRYSGIGDEHLRGVEWYDNAKDYDYTKDVCASELVDTKVGPP